MDIKDIFESLGLRQEHLKIYLASLEWGETSLSNLAYKSKLPRTTIYSLIDDLIAKGIITVSAKRDKKNYIPADPEYLLTLLKQKEVEVQHLISKLNNNMDTLKTIQNKNDNKPKIHYLAGAEGIMQAYEMTFNTDEVLVQCLTSDYGVVPVEYFEGEDGYFNRFFLRSNVKSKEILAEESDDSEYITKYSSGKNLQLRVPVSGDLSTDFFLFDNTVVFVSFSEKESYALVVEDPKVANCMRNLFNLAWESASKKDKRIQNGEKVLTEYADSK